MRTSDEHHSPPSTFSQITKAPHLPLGTVMLRYRPVLAAMGLRDPLSQLLGKGSFGAAYEIDLGGKSVLKFTRDPTEAQTSTYLINKRSKHVVDIHGTWVLADTHTEKLRGWYVVHRSYLNPLTKRDAKLVDAIFDLYNDDDLDLKLPRLIHRQMTAKWRTYLSDELLEREMSDPQSVTRGMLLVRQIADSVHALHALGVDWEDIHSGNLMRRADGTMVIGDVGYGVMHEDTRIEVPELTVEIASEYRRRLSAA